MEVIADRQHVAARARHLKKGRASLEFAADRRPQGGLHLAASKGSAEDNPRQDLGQGVDAAAALRTKSLQALAAPQQPEAALLEQIEQLRIDREQLVSQNQLLHRMMESQTLFTLRPTELGPLESSGLQASQLLADGISMSRKRPVVGIAGPRDDACGPAFRPDPHPSSTSGSSGDAFITGYEALLEQLVRLLKKLEDDPDNGDAKQTLDKCIAQQRACLLRLTEAGDATPLLHVMEHIRLRQLQWSSHEVTQRHAIALAASDLSWWQKDKLAEAAAAYYQQMAVITLERQAAAAALKQALESGPPALGRTGEQYKAVRSAQQRLRDTHMAEAGVFWALSNHFIMKDTLTSEQAARLQATLGSMLLDVAVAGRLLLAERPSRYTHLSLPMPLPEAPSSVNASTAQQHGSGKDCGPAHSPAQPQPQSRVQQHHAVHMLQQQQQPAHSAHALQQQRWQQHASAALAPQQGQAQMCPQQPADLAGMLHSDLAGLQAALQGQCTAPHAVPGLEHIPGSQQALGLQPPAAMGRHAAPGLSTPVLTCFEDVLRQQARSQEQALQHHRLQQQQQQQHAGLEHQHGKLPSPSMTNSTSSRGSQGPTETLRQVPALGNGLPSRPASERGHMSPPPVLPSRASTPGGRDGPHQLAGSKKPAGNPQELTSHRQMLMMHHQMMVSQRQHPVSQHVLSQQQAAQQQQQHQLSGTQRGTKQMSAKQQGSNLQQPTAPQQQHYVEQCMSQQLSHSDAHLSRQGSLVEQLMAQQSMLRSPQQMHAWQSRQDAGMGMHNVGLPSPAARQSPELFLGHQDPLSWPGMSMHQGADRLGSGLLQEPIWPEDGELASIQGLAYGQMHTLQATGSPSLFQGHLPEPNTPSLDDLHPMLRFH